MRAEVAVGIIVWSLLLNLPFLYRKYNKKDAVPRESIEYRIIKESPPLKIELPWKTQQGVVDCCSGIAPECGICFFMKDDARIIYKFDERSEYYLGKSLELLKIFELDDLYSLYVHIDKNKDRVLDVCEARGLYNASLSRQR